MAFQPATPGSLFVFLLIVAAILAAFVTATLRAYRETSATRGTLGWRAVVISFGWLGALSWLVASGRLADLPLSGLPFFFGAVLGSGLALGLSPLGARLAATVPMPALIGFQSFRLPLELVLHRWADHGTIPMTMTWSGQNWDIVSGVAAVIVLPWARRSRVAAWAFNLIGLALLINVARVALLSSPVPFGWQVSPPLVLALHWPYALIGPVCVAGALAGHVVLTRALLLSGRRDRPHV